MIDLEHHLIHQLDVLPPHFFWHELRARAVASFLPRKRPFALVDIGAGPGQLGLYLRNNYPHCTYRFVEPLEPLSRRLEGLFGSTANAGAWQDFRGVEYVALLDVLEHQPDDAGFLAELANKMDPGATLLVTVPAFERLWSSWDDALGHYRRYDRQMFLRLVGGTAFEATKSYYLFPELLPGAWLRTWTRRTGQRGTPTDAEFPKLPRLVNGAFYAIGVLSWSCRRWLPFGTSLLAALLRR
jgi:hypothetical protein